MLYQSPVADGSRRTDPCRRRPSSRGTKHPAGGVASRRTRDRTIRLGLPRRNARLRGDRRCAPAPACAARATGPAMGSSERGVLLDADAAGAGEGGSHLRRRTHTDEPPWEPSRDTLWESMLTSGTGCSGSVAKKRQRKGTSSQLTSKGSSITCSHHSGPSGRRLRFERRSPFTSTPAHSPNDVSGTAFPEPWKRRSPQSSSTECFRAELGLD